MSKTTHVDPVALVNGLNADQIRDRLKKIDHEQRALKALLKVAEAMGGPKRRKKAAPAPTIS